MNNSPLSDTPVGIRLDSSLVIGTGHLCRMLTLADELRARGADVQFICRNLPGNRADLLRGAGYEVRMLRNTGALEYGEQLSYASWLGAGEKVDADETVAALASWSGDSVIICDHYAIGETWERTLRDQCTLLVAIDDLANRRHDADLLVDQNLFHGMKLRYHSLVDESCTQLLGPRYALLRPEFREMRPMTPPKKREAETILLFLGGIDLPNMTDLVLRSLALLASRNFRVHALIGAGNPHKESLTTRWKDTPWLTLHAGTESVAKLMAKADLVIGGGGTTTWERCALGLPAIVVLMAENQRELSVTAQEFGFVRVAGEATSLIAGELAQTIAETLSDPDGLHAVACRAYEQVDGLGCQRVVDAIESHLSARIAHRTPHHAAH